MASSCLSNLEQVDIFNEVENLQAIVLWMVLIMSHTTPISFTKFLKVNSVMKKMNTKSDRRNKSCAYSGGNAWHRCKVRHLVKWLTKSKTF